MYISYLNYFHGAIMRIIRYPNIKFPNIIPMSFSDDRPNKSVLGFLKIYRIPNGKNKIGKKIKY